MTLGIAADKLRPAVEKTGDKEMRGDLTALTAGYFKLVRLSENAALVHSVLSGTPVVLPVGQDLSLLCQAVLDAIEDSIPGLSGRSRPGSRRWSMLGWFGSCCLISCPTAFAMLTPQS